MDKQTKLNNLSPVNEDTFNIQELVPLDFDKTVINGKALFSVETLDGKVLLNDEIWYHSHKSFA